MNYIIAMSFITLLEVSIKAFQQLNVVHNKWLLVPPCSYGLAFTGVYTIHFVSSGEANINLLALAMGTGGWIGCFVSMWLHGKMRG